MVPWAVYSTFQELLCDNALGNCTINELVKIEYNSYLSILKAVIGSEPECLLIEQVRNCDSLEDAKKIIPKRLRSDLAGFLRLCVLLRVAGTKTRREALELINLYKIDTD